MPEQSIHRLRVARDLMIRLVGGWTTLLGATMILNGPGGLASGVFTASRFLPWWVWGAGALTAGVLTLIPHTAAAGLRACVAWFGLWGVILGIGAIQTQRSLYAISIYGLVVSLVIVLVILHRDLRRLLTTQHRDGAST